MTPETLQQLLARAKSEELGIAIECHNPDHMWQLLEVASKGDRSVIIARPSTPGVVFIVKRTVELYDDKI